MASWTLRSVGLPSLLQRRLLVLVAVAWGRFGRDTLHCESWSFRLGERANDGTGVP